MFYSCKNVKLYNEVEKTFYIDTDDIESGKSEICTFFNEKKGGDLTFEREIKIIENNLSDTIILGFSVLPPNQTGNIYYSRFENNKGEIVSLYEGSKNPSVEKICFSKYNHKTSKGKLTIAFTLDEGN